MKVALYARVSTDKQELEQQVASCMRFCEFKEFKDVEVFAEVGSGKSFARAELQKMLARLRNYEFGAVVTFRFDRLGRNAREVALFFDEMESKGIQVFSINENLDSSTPIGRAMRDIIIRLAQLERENISEATKQRLSSLKKLGKTLGRPKRKIDLARVDEMRADGKSWREIAQAVKAPQSSIRSALRCAEKEGLETARKLAVQRGIEFK